jgi:hypothetical protein
MLAQLEHKRNKSAMMACSFETSMFFTKQPDAELISTSRNAEGLWVGHAYTVIDVLVDPFDSGCNLIQLRNPHAECEWSGAWSDGWDG